VWRFLSGGPLLLAASCSAPDLEAAAPTVTVQQADGGELIAIESDAVLDGRRPKLTLVCRAGQPATFRLDLVDPPANAPTERVFAQMQVKGGPEVTIELKWLGGAGWEAKMPDPNSPDTEAPDRNNKERVVPVLHAFSRERALAITPPPDHGPKQRLVFSPETYEPQQAAVQRCAALDTWRAPTT
jgi:hypothetical protein